MTKAIKSFTGRYSFLSNFYVCPVPYEGITYPTSEHAFQAAKTHDTEIRKEIAELATAMQSKKFGRTIPLRMDWEDVKIGIMEEVCYIKFNHNPRLKEKLIATGDAHLEEGNHHGDTFWGTVEGEGQNKLGFVLMRVRRRFMVPIEDTSGFGIRRRKL